MKKLLYTIIIVCIFIMLIGCQQQEESNEGGPLDGLFQGLDLSYNEYKYIFEDVVQRGKSMNVDNGLEKWVIRALGDEKLTNKRDLTKEEATKQAEYAKSYYEALEEVSEEKYNISISDAELDEWISNGPDQHEFPQQRAYAEALGLTVKQLNHEYDKDLYHQTVLYERLIPVLQKEYGTQDGEILREKFHKEVEDAMK
ncbi:hypothetical protein FIU87_07480 [Bacillus sp. THAF10]|uniref:hypothetical protein n=1 Tax=Bacillus sp. THAF10 TaxID=2587848 RepID=UPI001268F45B|nr:hypothetical protein [Bacillus sp. THAF10]QFT88479.1 hypothetical protein FIU87_07480 [Bacillus sp. THAF10]